MGNFEVMVAGRSVLGIGAEFTYIVVPVLVTRWFAGKEVSLALGIAQCLPFLVSASTGYYIPHLSMHGLAIVFGLGAAVCVISWYGGSKLIGLNFNALDSEEAEEASSSFDLKDIFSLSQGVYIHLADSMINFAAISTLINIGSKEL